ncbi:MAG TPA: hypothetical protein VMT93_10540 [Gemmatimonadaceae bacterium]|nr:hypothetical protein [Gemmatimonadaceae bacterium]
MALAAAALWLGACQEQLRGGNACPSLCPEQTIGFQDTVFTAAQVIDTMITLPGTPPLGTEPTVLLARYVQGGDSVVSGGVFRFDSVTRAILLADTTKAPIVLTSVDSAYLKLTFQAPPTGQDSFYVKDSTVTFIAYNVFVNAPDLDTAPVHAKFSGTPIGSLTMTRDSLQYGIKIPLDTAWLTTAVTTGQKVWIGVAVQNANGARVIINSSNSKTVIAAAQPLLEYLGHADTSNISILVSPNARATVWGPAIPALGDYQMIFKGSNAVPAGLLGVGGLPQNRLLVRFKFPSWLIDSSTTVVRANLELQQAPYTQYAWDSTAPDADTVQMHPYTLVAAPSVTDFFAMGILVGDVTATSMRNTYMAPTGAGLDTVPLVALASNVFNYWKAEGSAIQRGVVFAMVGEGVEPRQLLFYGPGAAPALRPRVHISYVPHSVIGLP